MTADATLYGIRDRLRRLGAVSVSPAPPPVQDRGADLTRLLLLLGADEHVGEGGTYLRVSHVFPDGHGHGGVCLTPRLCEGEDTLSLLGRDDRLRRLDPGAMLFFDTETTGLAGGTGTLVFLVGMAWFEGNALRVEQLFLPGPADERAFLAAVARPLTDHPVLVSYNGRCFDAPLLQARYTLQRRRLGLTSWPHLDLLYPARAVYRPRLPDCSLGTVEAHVLGVRRTEEDIPGALIPGIYFDYLRHGAIAPMRGVFYHNLMDVLSLVGLTRTLAGAVEGRALHPLDHVGAGRIFERATRLDEARLSYGRALQTAHGYHQRQAMWQLARLHKQMGDLPAAAELWRALVEARGDPEADAHVELAKYLEHRLRDFEAALAMVMAALALPAARDGRLRGELEHRRQRLERKLGRARAPRTEVTVEP